MNVELEIGVGRDRTASGRARAISELRWDMDLVAAVLAHLDQRLRKSGDDLPDEHWDRSLAGVAVEHTAVLEPAFIVDQDSVLRADQRARPGLDGFDLHCAAL